MSTLTMKPQAWSSPAAFYSDTSSTQYFPDDLMTDRPGIIIPPVAQKAEPA